MEKIEELLVSKVDHSFGFNDILKDISFTLKKAQVLSIVGPSGGGKNNSFAFMCKTIRTRTWQY